MAAKLYIVYYSMYGHVEKLAHEIKNGASTVEGVETTLWQVPETLRKPSASVNCETSIIGTDDLGGACVHNLTES